MRIGLPREIKDGEFRVALTPRGVRALREAGHEVVVEAGAGEGAGFSDAEYGIERGNAWDCDLVVKVKELQPSEYVRPRRGQTIFGFQHFGPHPELLDAALASGASFVAYETVGQSAGSLPILAPMSAIAGRLAIQVGAWCLQKQNGGSGVLLSGLDGLAPASVAILGAGNVGANALAVANALGATITVFAKSERRFAALRERFQRVRFSNDIRLLPKAIESADLVVGGILTPGQMSPKLITRAILARMRPGAALVDVGIDQGGIAETSRPTSHRSPIYVEEGIVHYCVPNIPSACARTASLALERAVLPFVSILARKQSNSELATGVQVRAGKVTHEHLARDTKRRYSPL